MRLKLAVTLSRHLAVLIGEQQPFLDAQSFLGEIDTSLQGAMGVAKAA